MELGDQADQNSQTIHRVFVIRRENLPTLGLSAHLLADPQVAFLGNLATHPNNQTGMLGAPFCCFILATQRDFSASSASSSSGLVHACPMI